MGTRRRVRTRRAAEAIERYGGSSTDDNLPTTARARTTAGPLRSTTPSVQPSTTSTTSILLGPITPSSAASEVVVSEIDQPLLPRLLALLTCRSCHRLYREPTTLACGHTVCLPCSALLSSKGRLPTLSTLPPLDLSLIDPSTQTFESQFARNPPIPLNSSDSNSMARSNSGNSLLSGLLNRGTPPPPPSLPRHLSFSGVRGLKPTCPYPSCSHKDRGTTLGEAKTDYVLQKVLGLVKREIPSIEMEMNSAETEEGDLDEEMSPVSGTSTGGGDDPVGDEENKRSHRTKDFESSKRVRRASLGPTLDDDAEQVDLEKRFHHLTFNGEASIPSTFLSELQSELECQVCVQLFHDPLTTPCGHTFCKKCLARSLDHSGKCPLCRSDFPSFTFFHSHPVNSTTRSIISSIFPALSAERKGAIEAEEKSNTFDTAIFVCTLAWPNLPTYIHIFEPRYRLMMRRVMEGDRQFGMVLPSRHDGGLSEYGTMLQVQSCNMIEDGRSIVEAIGSYRFKLLEHGTLDGYIVGRIERVDDISSEQEAELERLALARNRPGQNGTSLASSRRRPSLSIRSSPPVAPGSGTPPLEQAIELSTAELMAVCVEFVQTLRTGSAPWVLQRLNNTSQFAFFF